MVIAEASAVVASIKATIEIAKGLKASYDAKTITQAQTQILEHLLALQVDALALQEKHSVLIHEKEELKKKLMEFEQWRKTESEYELKEIKSGKFAYALKKSQQSEVPPHWLCINCWDDRKKSILQKSQRGFIAGGNSSTNYICPRCKFSFVI